MSEYTTSLFVEEMEAVMETAEMMVPPAFDPTQWTADEPQPPHLYRGLKCGFDKVAEMVVPTSKSSVELLGKRIKVTDSFFTRAEGDDRDPNQPVFFVATGRTYRYVVSIWSDRVVVNVENRSGHDLLSTEFPETEAQLRQTFESIVADCSK